MMNGPFKKSICQSYFPVIMMNGFPPVHMPGFLPCDYDEWISTSPYAMGSNPMIMMNGPFKKFICHGFLNSNLVDVC